MKKIFLAVSTMFLLGCDFVKDESSKSFDEPLSAVTAFFYDNMETLKGLNSKQEMLGWILDCNGTYRYTDPVIGGYYNTLPKVTSSCKRHSVIHTHPVIAGRSVDYFSKADLSTGNRWPVYLLSQENCYVRVAHNTKDEKGELLGRLRYCR